MADIDKSLPNTKTTIEVPGQTEIDQALKEDVIEVVVDNAVMILAGDIESMLQYQRANGNVQSNT